MCVEAQKLPTLHFVRNQSIYTIGDSAIGVYFLESGRIKLLVSSPEGKEGLVGIAVPGDLFGELSLAGACRRDETASAMDDSTVIRVPVIAFLSHLRQHSLVEGFAHYLAWHAAEQRKIIGHLLTLDCEHRLAEVLLRMAERCGKQALHAKRIDQRITHEELAQMVGTTRPRVSEFMCKFRKLGLITWRPDCRPWLVIDDQALAGYAGLLPSPLRSER